MEVKMKWIPVLNTIVWILTKIMTDDDKNGMPDVLEGKGRKQKKTKDDSNQKDMFNEQISETNG